MGFELSLKFRLRYLIAREYPRGLPDFILYVYLRSHERAAISAA